MTCETGGFLYLFLAFDQPQTGGQILISNCQRAFEVQIHNASEKLCYGVSFLDEFAKQKMSIYRDNSFGFPLNNSFDEH